MGAKHKIIIDTDPGVDDIFAMLLALSASPEDVELLLLSVTYGNVPLQSCLRNVIALFHVLEQEMAWRKSTGRPEGFDVLKNGKPIVAAGPEHSLEDENLAADYFHGADGLHGVHDVYPHLSPTDTWKALFHGDAETAVEAASYSSPYFTASKEPSHKEILRILKENPEDTVSILTCGPLTNVAIAASEDPETFLKVKELIVMGGAVTVHGNCTPVAEFNCWADPIAAARVYALTSYTPSATMPPVNPNGRSLPPYPEKLSRRLKLTLCPLDITDKHVLTKSCFTKTVDPLVEAGSPLATWTSHFMKGAFKTIEAWTSEGAELGLGLHDPLTVWYAITRDDPKWKGTPKPEDIRIETSGQWTHGMHVSDRRSKIKPAELAAELSEDPRVDPKITSVDDVHGDSHAWLSMLKCNRINRLVESPGQDLFKDILMKQIFG